MSVTKNDVEHDFSIWSYVYRGSKVYSDSRDANKINFTLFPEQSIIIELIDIVHAEPGEYKLKIKLNKDNQKTNKEIKWDIEIIEEESFAEKKQIRIEECSFTIDPARLNIFINSTFEQDFVVEVQLCSTYSLDKRETIIEQGNNNLVSFDIAELDHTTPFFVKLMINDTLIDVEEIILTNPKKKITKPFELVTGDIVLSNSTIMYESSSVKGVKLAMYLLLTISIIINCWFIWRKRKS